MEVDGSGAEREKQAGQRQLRHEGDAPNSAWELLNPTARERGKRESKQVPSSNRERQPFSLHAVFQESGERVSACERCCLVGVEGNRDSVSTAESFPEVF